MSKPRPQTRLLPTRERSPSPGCRKTVGVATHHDDHDDGRGRTQVGRLVNATITTLDCGWMRAQERTLVSGGSRDEFSFPIPAYLIRHDRGVAVFDAGLHPDLATSVVRLGDLARNFTVELEIGGTIAPRLAAHGIDPNGPITAIISHCHFDHVGGLVELPNARVIAQGNEWRAGLAGDGIDVPMDDLGHDVLQVDGDHDVFGDGTVTCVPTPGHTCGHQSLRVLTAGGPIILASDACYFAHTLDDEVLPPFSYDVDQQRSSLAMLQRERATGTTIVPGHDATAFRSMITT